MSDQSSALPADTDAPAPVSGAFSASLIASLERLRLKPRSLAGSRVQGGRRSQLRGRSLEFSDFRNYAAGDDPRDIDWNAVARLDTLLIRVFQAEVSLPMKLVVDASPSMDWGRTTTKLAQALRAAGALAYVASLSDTRAMLPGEGGKPLANLQRSTSIKRFLQELDGIAISPPKHRAEDLLARLVKEGASQSVVLLTDGYEAETLLPHLRTLASRGAEVSVVHVLHEEEIAPSIQGEYLLTGAEDGATVRVSINEQSLADYKARLNRFLASWRRECTRIGAGYALLSTGTTMQALCSSLLLEAGLAARRRGG